MARYLAFDLETTGTDPTNDRIVEFCFIELDDELKETARWQELVNPEITISDEVIAIHGITNEMVAGKPPFAHFAARIQGLIQGTTLIGHNVRFDIRFLHEALQRAGQPGLRVDHASIDTQYVEAIIHPRGLGALYQKYTGEELDDAHRSAADTAATVEVLRHQLQNHGGKEIPSTLAELEVNALKQSRNPDQAISWLDHGQRFYEDSEGNIRFGFGKHRHKPASSEPDYLQWMLRQDFPADVKAIIQEQLFSSDTRS